MCSNFSPLKIDINYYEKTKYNITGDRFSNGVSEKIYWWESSLVNRWVFAIKLCRASDSDSRVRFSLTSFENRAPGNHLLAPHRFGWKYFFYMLIQKHIGSNRYSHLIISIISLWKLNNQPLTSIFFSFLWWKVFDEFFWINSLIII